jgi:uncharacterized membrane protein
MGDLKNAKILGGIGALLMLVGWIIPTAGILIVLVGLILLFIGVKYIADETKDNTIFRNYMYYFICTFIAIVAVCAILFSTLASVGGIAYFTSFQNMNITDPMAAFNYLAPFLAGCVVAFLIGWIFIIIGAFYLKKSYNSITEHTKVGLFKTTGLVYLIGAFTLIIFIGVIIIIIAKIMEIIAFFTLPEKLPDVLPTGAPGIAGQQPGRICPNCGRPIPMDSQVCPYCGKDFRPPI